MDAINDGISHEVEMLARMWIECDPNRMGGEPGSGFHPDDTIGPSYESSSGGKTRCLPNTPLTGKPRWHWFIPRAEATLAYLDKHGFTLALKAGHGDG